MRSGALIGLVGLALVASAAARPVAATAACKAALVGGASTCLKVGQACAAKHARDYQRAGFACRAGRLRLVPSAATQRISSAPGSSRDNPVPLGKAAALGNGWTLTVTAVNLDATAMILAADPGNRPPLDGMQYVLVSISATYAGAGSSHLTPATTLRAAGAPGYLHTSANSFCGKLPPTNLDLDNPLVMKGGTITGYGACFMVPAGEVASLELSYAQPLTTTQLWFALH